MWVGDFDGDGIVDLLTMGPEVMGGECVTAWVHWVSLNQGVPEITGKWWSHLQTHCVCV